MIETFAVEKDGRYFQPLRPVPVIYKDGRPGARLIDLMVGLGLCRSTTEARRLILAGAVRLSPE